MSEKTRIEKIYSAFFRQGFPVDMACVFFWLVASIVVIYLPILNTTIVRVVLAFPIILFIPGYCFIAALFPKEGDIDLIERIGLSIVLSIAVVSVIGYGLNFTPWGIRLDPIVIVLSLFTLVMIGVTLYRRSLIPITERFSMPFTAIVGTIRNNFFPVGGTRVDRFISVAITLAILIALVTLLYLIAVPNEGEHFTEFYLLGQNHMAADYPETITPGTKYPLYIGIENHEFRNITYTIETWMMRTEFNKVTNTTSIVTMDPKDRLSVTLTHNDTLIIPYNLSVNKAGYNRVEFLLFNESVPGIDVPNSDRVNASYRELHLRVNVL